MGLWKRYDFEARSLSSPKDHLSMFHVFNREELTRDFHNIFPESLCRDRVQNSDVEAVLSVASLTTPLSASLDSSVRSNCTRFKF